MADQFSPEHIPLNQGEGLAQMSPERKNRIMNLVKGAANTTGVPTTAPGMLTPTQAPDTSYLPSSQREGGQLAEHERFKEPSTAPSSRPSPVPQRTTETAPAPSEGEQPGNMKPLPYWNGTMKNFFKLMPADLQKVIMDNFRKTEKFYDASLKKIDAEYKTLQPLFNVMQKHEVQIRRTGIPFSQFLDNILMNNEVLVNNPYDYIISTIERQRIPVEALICYIESCYRINPRNVEATRPQYLSVINMDMTNRMNQINLANRGVMTQTQANMQGAPQLDPQAQAQAAAKDQMIADFINDVDAEGNSKHPYFDDVEPIMAIIIQTTGDPDLETAYEQALQVKLQTDAKFKARVMEELGLTDTSSAENSQQQGMNLNKTGLSGYPGQEAGFPQQGAGMKERVPQSDLKTKLRANLNSLLRTAKYQGLNK